MSSRSAAIVSTRIRKRIDQLVAVQELRIDEVAVAAVVVAHDAQRAPGRAEVTVESRLAALEAPATVAVNSQNGAARIPVSGGSTVGVVHDVVAFVRPLGRSREHLHELRFVVDRETHGREMAHGRRA
jgi:hypothetical protein